MKFAHIREANISHLRSKYFTAKLFHLPAGQISLKKAHIVLVDKCVLFSGGEGALHIKYTIFLHGFLLSRSENFHGLLDLSFDFRKPLIKKAPILVPTEIFKSEGAGPCGKPLRKPEGL